MSSLVHHSSASELGDDEIELNEDFEQDVAFAQRASRTPIIGRLKRSRVQWFYILEAGTPVPRELTEGGYDDIKRSAICLSPTPENLSKLKRSLKKACDGKHVLVDIRHSKCFESDVIYYTIRTRIKRQQH